jgi:ParB/RepB/Spo0J family partition protein
MEQTQSTPTTEDLEEWQVVWCHVTELTPHPENPRVITPDSVAKLAESIRANLKEGARKGVKVPLHITPDKMILGGHRRHQAAQIAGQEWLPCIIRDIPRAQQLAFMIEENVERQSLSPIEEAQVYEKLVIEYSTVAGLCREKGLSATRVNSRLTLLKLPVFVQDLYHQLKLPLKVAPWLTTVKDEPLCINYATRISEGTNPAKLQEEHAAYLRRLEAPVQPPTAPLAPKPTSKSTPRTQQPHVLLRDVQTPDDARAVYLQGPVFTVSSTKAANVSRKVCQDCGNTSPQVCQSCPLFAYLKALPEPSALEKLAVTRHDQTLQA